MTSAALGDGPRYSIGLLRRPLESGIMGSMTHATWTYKDRSGHTRETELWLYPELDGSAVLDDFCDDPGDAQLDRYVRYLQQKHPDWLAADAVPICWLVEPVAEGPPFSDDSQGGGQDFLTFYAWPVNTITGEPLHWFALEVRHSRFPQFGEALGWLPSPLQRTAPLRSILAHRVALRSANRGQQMNSRPS